MQKEDEGSLHSQASGEVVTLPENWTTQLGWLFDMANYETYSKVVRLIQMWQGVRASTADQESVATDTKQDGICSAVHPEFGRCFIDAEEHTSPGGQDYHESESGAWEAAPSPEATSAASPLIHSVTLSSDTGVMGEWQAFCHGCEQRAKGDLSRVAFWKDQHEADTLVPTLTNESIISSQGRPAASMPPAEGATSQLRDECRATEGMTGIECDRYPGHQDWHSGKHEPRTDGTESVGYPVHIQWPRMNYDRCAPASSTFREGDREPQPDVRLVRGWRTGRAYERRSEGYGGHWDYRTGYRDEVAWLVWEALLREERSVEVVSSTEQEDTHG